MYCFSVIHSSRAAGKLNAAAGRWSSFMAKVFIYKNKHFKDALVQDRKTCTARTTYCLQMGHSLISLPHFVHVTMCPHSRSTQSIGESIQILQRFSSMVAAAVESVCNTQEETKTAWTSCGILYRMEKLAVFISKFNSLFRLCFATLNTVDMCIEYTCTCLANHL